MGPHRPRVPSCRGNGKRDRMIREIVKVSTGAPRGKRRGRLPGDPTRERSVHQMIRVDQAGEYGAIRIYEGQLRVLGCALALLRAGSQKEFLASIGAHRSM